jgi:hypothetical protein
VVTVRGGRIVRLEDYRSRAAAWAPTTVPRLRAPWSEIQPGRDEVSDMVALADAADVERSIACYARLGFQVRDTYGVGGRLDWAFLQAGQARLMLAHADTPIAPMQQAVFFYLYSRDLFAMRKRLVAAGVDAGEIHNGRPGPRLEMRLEDPDGYVLMVAQIEKHQVSGDAK